MKKSKGQTVDLLYTKKEETKKRKSVGSTASRTHKNKKNTTKKIKSDNSKTINLDNEIIIGLTPKRKEKKKKEKKQTNKKNLREKTKNVGTTNSRPHRNSKITKKKNKQTKIKRTKKLKIVKYTILSILIIVSITMIMMSSLFNIKQIDVVNNSKISSEEIISLSGLTIETNMFKTSKYSINNNIKANPYIENVNVKRKLNGIVVLEVQERTPTYMLQIGNSYVYINNQGYMLELTEAPLELPVITGIETSVEEIKEGNRLVVNDLQKLEDIIKIMESAKSNSISNLITSIDISDKSNYKLAIASEDKTVQFGDTTNINIKLLKIEEIIQQEKGITGEIYFQDSEKTVFREMVSF